jgi:hypothetical protein
MRRRVPTVLLALTGLLVAIAVGLVANAIASRSFTPGVDALPSAGSLAPPAARTSVVPATGSTSRGSEAKPAVATPTSTPTATTATSTKPVTTATTPAAATAPAPVADDHGGKGKGSGDSGGHGKHGSDD